SASASASSEPPTTTTATLTSATSTGTALPPASTTSRPAATTAATTTTPAGSSSGSGGDPCRGRCDPGRCVQDIMAAIQPKEALAGRCSDEGLKPHAGIEGKITISFQVDPKGAVVKTELNTSESEITDAGVAACLGDIIKKTPFPASPKGCETASNY